MSEKSRTGRKAKVDPPDLAKPLRVEPSQVPPLGSFGKTISEDLLGTIGSTVKAFAFPPEYLEAVEKLRETTTGRIAQAAGTAIRARELEQEISLPPERLRVGPSVADRQLATMTALQKEMSHVAGFVVTMADSTTRLLEVAGDAQEGLLTLSAVAQATQAETGKLRTALEAGQAAAERASSRLERLTWVLVFLTLVLVVLTYVLLSRPTA